MVTTFVEVFEKMVFGKKIMNIALRGCGGGRAKSNLSDWFWKKVAGSSPTIINRNPK